MCFVTAIRSTTDLRQYFLLAFFNTDQGWRHKNGDNKKGTTEILFFVVVSCAYNTGSSPTSPSSNIFYAKFSGALFYMNFLNCALFEAKSLVHVSDRIMLF